MFWNYGYLYNARTVNGSTLAERTRQEIIRLCHSGLDSRTFRLEAVRHLRKAIPIDASFFATADPATLAGRQPGRGDQGRISPKPTLPGHPRPDGPGGRVESGPDRSLEVLGLHVPAPRTLQPELHTG